MLGQHDSGVGEIIKRMFPSAAEYVWLQERFPLVAESYCLTYVRGLTPDDVVERLAATWEGECRGVGALPLMSAQTWVEHRGERLLFGATVVDGWTLAVEVNGWLGVTESLLIPLSRATTVVSHFKNVNAVRRFYWVEDETIRLSFDPLFAFNRSGTDSDSLTEVLEGVGLELRSGEAPDFGLVGEAAFALATYLTGIRLTPEILESATYQCAVAAAPRG